MELQQDMQWTQREQTSLLQLVKQYGQMWGYLSRCLKRNADTIKKEWENMYALFYLFEIVSYLSSISSLFYFHL